MFWLILSVALILFSVWIFWQKANESYDWYVGGTLSLIFGILLIVLFVGVGISWQHRALRFSYAETAIQNKIVKIDEMKKSYREINNFSQVNIDMVNKDLTKGITDQINDLEEYIKIVNNDLAYWTFSYNNRFFTFCRIKPSLDKPISLADYINK